MFCVRLHFVHPELYCIRHRKHDVPLACAEALHPCRVTPTRSFPIDHDCQDLQSTTDGSIARREKESIVLCPWFWWSTLRRASLPNYEHSWTPSSESHRSIDLGRVQLIKLFPDLWQRTLTDSCRAKGSEVLTLWTGQIDFQSSAIGVSKSDEKLYVFERANSVASAFTSRHLEFDGDRFDGAQFSSTDNTVETSNCRLTYWTTNSMGSTRHTLCSGTLTQFLAISVIAAALRMPKPNRLLT